MLVVAWTLRVSDDDDDGWTIGFPVPNPSSPRLWDGTVFRISCWLHSGTSVVQDGNEAEPFDSTKIGGKQCLPEKESGDRFVARDHVIRNHLNDGCR